MPILRSLQYVTVKYSDFQKTSRISLRELSVSTLFIPPIFGKLAKTRTTVGDPLKSLLGPFIASNCFVFILVYEITKFGANKEDLRLKRPWSAHDRSCLWLIRNGYLFRPSTCIIRKEMTKFWTGFRIRIRTDQHVFALSGSA